jgi:hypothetical protein
MAENDFLSASIFAGDSELGICCLRCPARTLYRLPNAMPTSKSEQSRSQTEAKPSEYRVDAVTFPTKKAPGSDKSAHILFDESYIWPVAFVADQKEGIAFVRSAPRD